MIQKKSMGGNNSFVPGSNPEFLGCVIGVLHNNSAIVTMEIFWSIKELLTNSVFTKKGFVMAKIMLQRSFLT